MQTSQRQLQDAPCPAPLLHSGLKGCKGPSWASSGSAPPRMPGHAWRQVCAGSRFAVLRTCCRGTGCTRLRSGPRPHRHHSCSRSPPRPQDPVGRCAPRAGTCSCGRTWPPAAGAEEGARPPHPLHAIAHICWSCMRVQLLQEHMQFLPVKHCSREGRAFCRASSSRCCGWMSCFLEGSTMSIFAGRSSQ